MIVSKVIDTDLISHNQPVDVLTEVQGSLPEQRQGVGLTPPRCPNCKVVLNLLLTPYPLMYMNFFSFAMYMACILASSKLEP